MNTFYRKLFFWIVFILFLATTPLAILYSQGYRFDQYKKIFIHSGSITVKSTPSSVNIYLDGEIQPSGSLDIINNSLTVNGLRPGNYNLRVSADGYQDWEKNIEVHSGVSTEFWNVYLAPNNLAVENLNAEGFQRFFPSPFGKKIAYFKKNENQFEVWSLEVKSNQPTLIYSKSEVEIIKDLLENAEWNSKEKLIIVPVATDDRKDFLILDSEKDEEPVVLSQKGTFAELFRARWSSDNNRMIYFTAKEGSNSSKNLYTYDLDAKQFSTVAENIKSFDIANSAIYTIGQNDILYKTKLDGRGEEQITLSPVSFSKPSIRPRLIAYDDTRQAVISEEGELFIHNDSESDSLKKISNTSTSAQFSDDGKKLLYWNTNEINVLFLKDWEVQPKRIENENQQVIRFSSPISNVFWYKDYEHIFFSAQNKLKIIELDSRDHRTCSDLMNLESENFLSSYDASNGIIYFINGVGDQNDKLRYFYIPERSGFFGG